MVEEISLPDCFTLSLGKKRKTPALFSRRERELEEEIERKPVRVDIQFLEHNLKTEG